MGDNAKCEEGKRHANIQQHSLHYKETPTELWPGTQILTEYKQNETHRDSIQPNSGSNSSMHS